MQQRSQMQCCSFRTPLLQRLCFGSMRRPDSAPFEVIDCRDDSTAIGRSTRSMMFGRVKQTARFKRPNRTDLVASDVLHPLHLPVYKPLLASCRQRLGLKGRFRSKVANWCSGDMPRYNVRRNSTREKAVIEDTMQTRGVHHRTGSEHRDEISARPSASVDASARQGERTTSTRSSCGGGGGRCWSTDYGPSRERLRTI